MRIITTLSFIIVLALGSLFPLQIVFPAKTEIKKRKVTRQEAYDSICQISSVTKTKTGVKLKGSGSGILLPNGNVLTAAHCVDQNKNDKIDDDEKIIHIAILEKSIWIECEVIAISEDPDLDLALVKPKITLEEKGIQLAEQDVMLGDPVIVMGRRNSLKTSITEGVANASFGPNDRMISAASWFGGSGGAVYDKDHNLVGVLTSVGRDTMQTTVIVPIPREESLMFMRTGLNYDVVIPNMSFCVPLDKIKAFLEKHDQYKPEKEFKESPNPNKKWFYHFITWPSTGLLVFLSGLGLYRAYRSPRRR